ncbi:sigma-54-dependent Fis family transcriptional regulator [Aquibium carbonis]|uniref:Sigma-54-dependent Fis family transcriptional regulator n=1 Tax=Aquibium carbonis TaxID=2495581 RepID=A0A429YT44_9HYPH|nr:phosphoenolpyruvate hydrolase family protein [Aquibium carbonis]RST84635.1 sigma-54-dependent Fis family transcriptional regulator [Aquibium carbonis]
MPASMRHRFRSKSSVEPLVGAAIGVGMTAEAAERGGADFLLALNAGRYRVMGATSIAAMLPLADANRFTDHFARREILDRVNVPVFFGACVFDPSLDLGAFIDRIAATGYHGVANFPTSIHYDGRFRRALEAAGLGYAREVEMLRLARKAGLATFAYAKTRAEIQAVLDTGVDLLCLNFGWNAGGSRAVAQAFTLEEAADRARRIFNTVRQTCAETICLVEGGPIVNPEDMYRVCRDAKADGYVGGSTLDRMPLELSVMQMTSAFKAFGVLQQADAAQSRETMRAARLAGIAGQSQWVTQLLERLVKLSATNLPVLVVGERGLGRTTLARSLHALANRKGPLTVLTAADRGVPLEEVLFGAEPDFGRVRRRGALDAREGTVIVENAGELTETARQHVLAWLEHGETERIGGTRSYSPQGRLVLIATPRDLAEGRIPGGLAERLQRVDIKPLRDRLEDLPAHARLYLEMIGEARHLGPLEISADGYRVLFAHDWKENTRELRRVVEQSAVTCDGRVISSDVMRAVMEAPETALGIDEPLAEKDWILDALRRHRFRRGETATFLGISRKTLYNKMRRAGLLD